MISSSRMDSFSSSFIAKQQSKKGIMDDEKHLHSLDDNVSDSSDVSSVVSSDSDLFVDVNSSASSSPTSSPSSGSGSGSSSGQLGSGALQDMSSLLQELPFKRGLSKHYNGKSQSFTSLSNVRSLEDLAKPENPYKKKLKSCRSYGGFFESHGSSKSSSNQQPSRSSSSSRLMSKKGSRRSCSSLCHVKRNSSFIGTSRPPPIPPPHRSSSRSSFTTQTPLFALGV